MGLGFAGLVSVSEASASPVVLELRIRSCGILLLLNAVTVTIVLSGGVAFGGTAVPSLDSLSVTQGPETGGTFLMLNGSAFESSLNVTFGGVDSTNPTRANSALASCTTPPGTGIVDVVLTNLGLPPESDTLLGGFEYIPLPSIVSIDPAVGYDGGGTSVTIAGSGFHSLASVTIGGSVATSIDVVDSGTITCITPSGSVGAVDVVVTNPAVLDGTLAGGFTYSATLPPTVASLNIANGPAAGGTAVQVLGSDFVSGGSFDVLFGVQPATGVTWVNGGQINCMTPAGTGIVDVVVVNNDGQTDTLPGSFTYTPAPTVASLSSTGGPIAGGTTVVIQGTGFLSGPTVEFGPSTCTFVTFDGDTQLTVTTPSVPAYTGTVDVVVTNTDSQSGTLASAFDYDPPPTVLSLNPAIGPTSGGNDVVITGSGFAAGATVEFGLNSCPTVDFDSTSQLTVEVPNGTGTVGVTVTNLDAQAGTLAASFTYVPPPTVDSLDVTHGPETDPITVVITGSGFYDGATVDFGPNPCGTVTFDSPTQLTVLTPIGTGSVSVTVFNPDTQSGTWASLFTYDPPPVVSSLNVTTGPIAGGTEVIITGDNFVAGATVQFGAVSCSIVAFDLITQLTVDSPLVPPYTGTVAVTVTNLDGQSGTLSSAFAYDPAPTVVSLNTGSGPEAGETTVIITGTEFVDGATVHFGTDQCTVVAYDGDTQLTVDTPAVAYHAGTVDVTVTNPDNQADTLPGSFQFIPAPVAISLNVSNGPASGSTSVQITGTDFMSGTGHIVRFDGVEATGVVRQSPVQINCITPPGVGTVDVEVENPDGQTGSLATAFTYDPPPTVTSVVENHGPEPGGTLVQVMGTNFVNGGLLDVRFDGASAANVAWQSATQVNCETPSGSGLVDVEVVVPDGQVGTLLNGFTYDPPPTLSSLSVDIGPVAGGTPVTVTGDYFVDDVGLDVRFDGVSAIGVTFVNVNTITCTTPPGSGSVDVVVENPDGQTDTLVGGFDFLLDPIATSIDVIRGPEPGGTAVVVTGDRFVDGALFDVTFDGYSAAGVTWVSATEISCTSPPGSGTVDVVVVNGDGQIATLLGEFTYDPPPTVTSLDVANGPSTGGTIVQVTGTNFVDDTGLDVLFDGVSATGVTWVSAVRVDCTTPAGTGTVDVVVENPDGQTGTLSNGFLFDPPPVVLSLDVTNGPELGDTSVAITGTGFVVGATVEFGLNLCTTVTVDSDTQITALTPAGTGVVGVRVTNTDLQTHTLATAFTYDPPPTMVSLTPVNGPEPGGTVVRILGTDFLGGAGFDVRFDGVSATDIVLGGPTQIDCTTPAGVGVVEVVVINSDGQSHSLPAAYTYDPPPTVSSLNFVSGPELGGTAVQISGLYFVGGAGLEVTFGGTSATAIIFVNSTRINCATPPGTGVVDVVVRNPDAQAGTLASAFTYVPPPTLISLSVTQGAVAGGTPVTVTGTDFFSGAGLDVTFGGASATSVTYVNSSSITCVAPAGSGTVDVVVENPDGQTDVLAASFEYVPLPVIVSIDPTFGTQAGLTLVTITGASFHTNVSVTFGGISAVNTVRVNATTIRCNSPSGAAAGAVDVVVINPASQSDTEVNGFTYTDTNEPTFASVTPDDGAAGDTVVIEGANYQIGATVLFGDVPAASVTVDSNTQITCEVPSGSGVVDLTVVNADTQSVTASGVFTYQSITAGAASGTWVVGSLEDITWTADGIDYVMVELSRDGGVTWETLSESRPAMPSTLGWTVDGSPSDHVVFRISDAEDGSPAAVSSEFIIPGVQVVAPNGNLVWQIGDTATITWLSGGLTAIRLELTRDGGTTWEDIVSSTLASAKEYSWQVTGPGAGECLVRISPAGGGASDMSDRYFTITDSLPFLGIG